MTQNGDGNSKRVTIGDVLHFLEIAVMLIAIGVNYGKFQQIAADVSNHGLALDRIEHYLSSQDQQYWHKTHENGDAH